MGRRHRPGWLRLLRADAGRPIGSLAQVWSAALLGSARWPTSASNHSPTHQPSDSVDWLLFQTLQADVSKSFGIAGSIDLGFVGSSKRDSTQDFLFVMAGDGRLAVSSS